MLFTGGESVKPKSTGIIPVEVNRVDPVRCSLLRPLQKAALQCALGLYRRVKPL